MAARHQRVGDGDAQLARQMVIAGSGEAQRLVADGARLVARRHLERRHGDQALQHVCDQRRGDAVVAKATLRIDRDEAGLDQLQQVLAGRRPRDARQEGEFARGELLTAHQRRQDGGARGVADQGCDLDHVGGGDHAPS